MTFFERELHKLFDKSREMDDIRIVGNVCYGRLSDAVRVKIHFTTGMVANQYDALKVTLLNRCEGPIDSLLIRFRDIWGAKRTDHPNFRDGVSPHIWADGATIDWYVYKPGKEDYQELSGAVSEYLGAFREPVQELRTGQTMC